MQDRKHKITETGKKSLLERLRGALARHPEISFGYVHGSFVTGERFADIDIALYLRDAPASSLDYELERESELMREAVPYPVDVRVLNGAPLSFRYQVIKNGAPLIVNDDEKRTDFQEATLADYFDFAPYRAAYLQETLGLGV